MIKYLLFFSRQMVSTWKMKFVNLSSQGDNRTRIENREIRDEFCDNFISSGQASWQWEMI